MRAPSPLQKTHLWVALMMIVCCLASLPAVVGEQRQFLWFSDIHYDPHYGTELSISNVNDACSTLLDHPLGDFGCDSPLSLLEAILEKASLVEDVDFVVITGDFVRHGNDLLLPSPLEATQQILKKVSNTLLQYLDHIPIVPSLGNNDVTPDYYLDIDHPEEVLDMVTGGLGHLLGQTNESTANFRKGGYYARQVSSQLTILSLNTILYSTNHQPFSTQKDPLGQFAWLAMELEKAQTTHTFVYIMGHIPPTVGSYRHTQLWQEQYLERYYELVGHYSQHVKGQLFGHIHTEEFRVHGKFPIYLTSSFTPVYGSNPSFRVVTYDNETSDLLDYQVHYLDLTLVTAENHPMNSTNNTSLPWQLGQPFTKAFGVANMSVESLDEIVQDLQHSTDSQHWEALLNRQHAFAHGSEVCDSACRREWACTLTSMTSEEYEACLPSLPNPWVVVASAVAVLAIIVLLAKGWKSWQRRHYQSPMELQQQNAHVTTTNGGLQLPAVS